MLRVPEVEVRWDFRLEVGWVPRAGSDVVTVLLLTNGGVTAPLAAPLGASASTPFWSRSLRAGPRAPGAGVGGVGFWCPDMSGPSTQRLWEQTTAASKQNTCREGQSLPDGHVPPNTQGEGLRPLGSKSACYEPRFSGCDSWLEWGTKSR